MIFPKRVRFFRGVLGTCIFLAYSCCFVIADDEVEETCYRGDARLEYENPCSSPPANLDYCSRGLRLAEACTENCVYCDDGTYQDTFTNCLTCLPCTTAADCPPGQEIIKSCTVDSNAVCGCPPPPPCPVCPSCPTATPCPLVTHCPVQTECPACPTDAPADTMRSKREIINFLFAVWFVHQCLPEIQAQADSASSSKDKLPSSNQFQQDQEVSSSNHRDGKVVLSEEQNQHCFKQSILGPGENDGDLSTRYCYSGYRRSGENETCSGPHGCCACVEGTYMPQPNDCRHCIMKRFCHDYGLEDCYRGEAFLDYDNPCSGDPGQPAKYDLCHRGQRLEERCTERCVSCEAGVNYQDKLTNCLTCLPCKTEAQCLPGQGALEKLWKHFTHWHVMWAVTWILLQASLFYVSQINDNDNGVCSNKVSGMILAPPTKKLVLPLLFIMYTEFASASTYCAENQTAEIDAQGMINCSFPDNFYSVVWFDDVSESSVFAISCEAPCSVKEGPGFRSKYYDIYTNGSLWIPRVTVQHERLFEVFVYTSQDHFEKQTIYLKVIACPGQRLPTLDCNGITQHHYHKVNGKEILTCSFNATRPPVQLTWLQRTDEGDIQVKQQEKTVIENEDSTFNSSVTIDLITTPMENQLLLYVCKANWILQGWEKEKVILLDNRGLQSFDSEPNETLYLEQGRQANVRCKGSIGFLQLWEKISSNNGPEMIGFYTANGLTRAVATFQDPTISSEGHLIFSSPQVDDEGIYVCAYSHDMRNEVYVVAVTILIAPLPPYIHIKGCKDDNQACSLKAYDQGQISCFVMGVRPSVSLEWIASDVRKIDLHVFKETTKEHGSTSDTESSAEYKLISENINCGDDVYVKCRLSGPVSHIINRDERTVQLIREPCRHEEDKGNGLLNTVTVILASLCFITVMGLCIVVWLICKCHQRNVANGSHCGMAAEHIPMNGIETETNRRKVNEEHKMKLERHEEKILVN